MSFLASSFCGPRLELCQPPPPPRCRPPLAAPARRPLGWTGPAPWSTGSKIRRRRRRRRQCLGLRARRTWRTTRRSRTPRRRCPRFANTVSASMHVEGQRKKMHTHAGLCAPVALPSPPRAHPHPYLFAFVFYFVKHMDIKSVSFPIFASSARLTPRAQLQEARGTLLLFQEAQLQVSQPQEVRRTMLQQARRRIPGKWQPRSSGFAIFARWMDGRSGHWKPRAAWRLVA